MPPSALEVRRLQFQRTHVLRRQRPFAIYANNVAAGTDPDAITRGVGQALGEIAAAAYGVAP